MRNDKQIRINIKMSQQQPRKEGHEEGGFKHAVQGDMTKTKPDTAKTQKGAAATKNERPSDSVAGQVVEKPEEKERKVHKLVEEVEQFSQRAPVNMMTSASLVQETGGGGSSSGITIGEALEATVLTAGDKAVEWSDAAAIQAAEVRATGRTNIVPGGVAAAAQSAATLNARATKEEDKTKLADILVDATSKLPADRAATRRDAEGVTGAEMRNDPNLTTHPGGVSASVAAAARLNQTNNATN
ncbi:hypothetical protein VNO78_20349 [Psophocarpus tetragonolobus]|uniref:SMP domain-containing protein n=1 Tax=Psophocarpus tetragonolobus TaxID=3891 RepID=A0AAN9SB63_PSOTE